MGVADHDRYDIHVNRPVKPDGGNTPLRGAVIGGGWSDSKRHELVSAVTPPDRAGSTGE